MVQVLHGTWTFKPLGTSANVSGTSLTSTSPAIASGTRVGGGSGSSACVAWIEQRTDGKHAVLVRCIDF